jgi:tripartite-type tricarboxylate transporter receptor subunit TctC
MTTRRILLHSAAAASLATLGLPGKSKAQASTKLARIVVPFPAGGGTDAAARALAERIRHVFPSGLIVENRPGAAGRLGVEWVKNAEPDGLTMMFVPDQVLTIYPHSYRRLNYDPITDFAPVAQCAASSYALTAGPALPPSVVNVRQFIDWCSANPKSAVIANNSAGSPTHFVAVMLASSARIDVIHISYKGGAPALQDLIGGQVPVSVNPVGEVMPHLKSGKLRVLATTGRTRNRFVPEAPTLVESGLPNVMADAWLGVLMPGKTPAEAISRVAAAIGTAVQLPEVRDAYASFGMEVTQSTPASMAAKIKADIASWGVAVASSGFKAED